MATFEMPPAAEGLARAGWVVQGPANGGWGGAALDDFAAEFTREARRALRLDAASAGATLRVPLEASGGTLEAVRVRVGCYGALALRARAGSASAGGGASAVVRLDRPSRNAWVTASLPPEARVTDALELVFVELAAPAQVYELELHFARPGASERAVTRVVVPQSLDDAGWAVTGNPGAQVFEAPPELLARSVRGLRVSATDAPVAVRVPLAPGQRALELLRCNVACPGFLRIRARAVCESGRVVTSDDAEREAAPAGTTVELDLHALRRPDGAPEPVAELWLEVAYASEAATLFQLEALQRSAAAWLPSPDSGARHVRRGTESRRAVGVLQGAALRGALPPGAGGALVLDAALPVDDDAAGGTRLHVTLLADGAVAATHALGLTSAWTRHRVPLPLSAASELAVELRTDAVVGALVGAPRVEPLAPPGPERAPRTVLLVTSDTHRGDHVGYACVQGVLETPFLDALARDGVRFDDATSTTSITNPSHAAMFTGLPVRDTGIVGNLERLAERATTLAEVFEGAGFRTLAAVSARHLAPSRSGLGQGFERFDSPSAELTRDGAETIARARAMLADAAGEDVFLWVHLFEAHGPYLAHEGITTRYYGGDPFSARLAELAPEVKVAWDTRIRDGRYILALYKGEVSYLDGLLGGLFDAEPRLATAHVAFTADHGESLGEGGHYWTHEVLYPSTLRVPLILRGPGIDAGAVVTSGVSNLDLGRTLLEAAGVPARGFPGRSLLDPAARLERDREPRFVVGAHGHSAGVFSGRWYLVLPLRQNLWGKETRHRARLFDRLVDPACAEDLTAAHPDVARRLRAALVRWLAEEPVGGHLTGGAPTSSTAPADVAALGYASGAPSSSTGGWIDPACACAECAAAR